MTGNDTVQPDVADLDGSPEDRGEESPDALDATIGDVFDRLMTLDAAMSALADAEVGMVQSLQHAEAVADAYRGRPQHAEAVRHLEELRDVAYRTLGALAGTIPLAIDEVEGPPARGSSPQLVAPPRARRDTIADSPHALRDAPGDVGDTAPEIALTGGPATVPTAPPGDAADAPEPAPLPALDKARMP